MNCIAGDLAFIVRDTVGEQLGAMTCVSHVIGTHVRLTHAITGVGDKPLWAFKGTIRCPNCRILMLGLFDADLQPIRPPSMTRKTTREIAWSDGAPNPTPVEPVHMAGSAA